jgi:single-strand DNA-binding protein
MTMNRKGQMDAETDAVGAGVAGVNEVTLGGRISGSPVERELPSGDTVVQLRLVVPRSGPRRRVGQGGATVDTIDVACWTKALQRKAVRLKQGDFVTVRGALRRRFWRSPAGPASRYEVEATALDRGVVVPTST